MMQKFDYTLKIPWVSSEKLQIWYMTYYRIKSIVFMTCLSCTASTPTEKNWNST